MMLATGTALVAYPMPRKVVAILVALVLAGIVIDAVIPFAIERLTPRRWRRAHRIEDGLDGPKATRGHANIGDIAGTVIAALLTLLLVVMVGSLAAFRPVRASVSAVNVSAIENHYHISDLDTGNVNLCYRAPGERTISALICDDDEDAVPVTFTENGQRRFTHGNLVISNGRATLYVGSGMSQNEYGTKGSDDAGE